MKLSSAQENEAGKGEHCERESGTNKQQPICCAVGMLEIPEAGIQVHPEAHPKYQGKRWRA
jgi:hypothetical protein